MSPYSPVSPGSSPGYSHGQTVHSPRGSEHQSPHAVSPQGLSPTGVSPNRPVYAQRANGNPPRTLALDSQHYSGYVQDSSMGYSSSSIHSPPNAPQYSAKMSMPHYAAPLQRSSRNAMDTYSMNYRYCIKLMHLCDVEAPCNIFSSVHNCMLHWTLSRFVPLFYCNSVTPLFSIFFFQSWFASWLISFWVRVCMIQCFRQTLNLSTFNRHDTQTCFSFTLTYHDPVLHGLCHQVQYNYLLFNKW